MCACVLLKRDARVGSFKTVVVETLAYGCRLLREIPFAHSSSSLPYVPFAFAQGWKALRGDSGT